VLKSNWIPTELRYNPAPSALETAAVTPPGWGGAMASLLQLLRFGVMLLSLRFRRLTPMQKSVRVREFLEQRGGLWIKIAQTLASRHDILPSVYCSELGKLFDGATAFPGHVAREIIEASVGYSIDQVFESFSEQPFAAASIAQIHKARLRWNDVEVVIKVRRPYIEKIFLRDLKLIGILAWLFNKISRFRHLHLLDMHDELQSMLLEELDFRVEATQIRAMRKNLQRQHIVVPRVFSRYSTKDILVISFIDGVLMSDYLRLLAEDPLRALQWQGENNINPQKVARKIYLSCQRQIFEDNLFHCDLHPGNIMLLRNSHFALLDFGAVGSLDLQTRQQVMLYHRLIAEGDLSKAMMVLTHMSSPLPSGDLAGLLRRLVRVTQKSLRFMTVKGVPYEERIYSDATSQQLRLLGRARIPVSWDFLRAQRTFTVLEMSMRQLDPQMQPMKLSRRYFNARNRRVLRAAGGHHQQLFNHIETVVAEAATILRELSDAKALAGKIWGIGLDEVKAIGRRMLIGAGALIAGGLGLIWAGRYYMNGVL